jgi:hypothetical protein
MYMKFRTQLFIVAVVLIIIMGLTMYNSCCSFVPYGPDMFSKHYPYEGFGPMFDSAIPSTALSNEVPLGKPDADVAKKVGGFNGLLPSPVASDPKLDVFGGTKGAIDCAGSGYYNSKGGLCLTQVQQDALKTRGGNATGKPDSLGN